MSTILVGVDGSNLARKAVERAHALIGDDHRWELVTVVSRHPGDGTPVGRFDPPVLDTASIAADRRAAEEQAISLATQLGVSGEVRIETGDPGLVLCRLAASLPADLIVLGTHGRGPVGRALVGSVSQYVLGHAPCPVLIQGHATATR